MVKVVGRFSYSCKLHYYTLCYVLIYIFNGLYFEGPSTSVNSSLMRCDPTSPLNCPRFSPYRTLSRAIGIRSIGEILPGLLPLILISLNHDSDPYVVCHVGSY